MAGPRYSILPADAVFDSRLSRLALHVLAALGGHADNNGWCVVRQKTLAAKIGSSTHSVRNALRELVELGYVRCRSRYADSGAQIASLYQVVMDREPPAEIAETGIDADEKTVPNGNVFPASDGGEISHQAAQADVPPASPRYRGGNPHVTGGVTPTLPHKNDPSSERPLSSNEDGRAGARRPPKSSKPKSAKGSSPAQAWWEADLRELLT